jgi:hypothetical protein
MQFTLNDIVNKETKPHAYEKWCEVFKRMRVHTQGITPLHIFEERRPLESEDENALTYRANNSRPITKDEFDKAISHYQELAQNVDVVIDYKTSTNKDYIESLLINNGLKKQSLKEWFFKKVGSYKQTDPNAVVVILPKHTSEVFVPSYKNEIPNFNNIVTNKIEVEIRLISHSSIRYIDADTLVFNGGNYEYKDGYSSPFYYILTKERTTILKPKEEGNKLVYVEELFYNNNLDFTPFTVIGTKLITEVDEDSSEIIEYYTSDFIGACAWGDLALGQNSDLQISEVRFIFPRHWKIKVKCDNQDNGCHLDQLSGKYVVEKETICQRCKGTGYVMDSSPLGTTFIDSKDLEDGKFAVPEGFVTPPSDILKHSADRVAYYMSNMRKSLGLTDQNMTAQSGESKSYDYIHTIAMNTIIVTDLYNTYEYILNVIDQYRNNKSGINILFPDDFDVRSADDILYEITEAKSKNLPNAIISELTKKYILKKFGKTKETEKIVKFLSIYDKLFIYGVSDVAQNQISNITDNDRFIHNLGYQILLENSKVNLSFMALTDVQLLELINSKIAEIPKETVII